MKNKLNSIYGKQIYYLSKREKEYLFNDTRITFFAYIYHMLNSMYFDTDSVTIKESESRKNARTILEFIHLN